MSPTRVTGKIQSSSLADFGLDGLQCLPTTLQEVAMTLPFGTSKATIGNQVLPDCHGIATPAESQLDCLPVGLAGAGSGTAAGNRRQLHLKLRNRLPARFDNHLLGLPRQSR
jgi:hypothetical protein